MMKDEESGLSLGARACRWWSLVLAFVLFPAPAFALIITLTFESGSTLLAGGGTPGALLNVGKVSAFGPLKPGVSRTVGASSYTISTTVQVRVKKVASPSPNYTLQARLQAAHPLTWLMDGVTLSTSPVTVATSQPFGSAVPHTLSFVVPYSHPAGAVTTVVEVIAIAN